MGIKISLASFLWCVIAGGGLAKPNAYIPQAPVQPSPWWIVERFGRNLVIDTQIDLDRQQVLLTIDTGVWSTLDYLTRYSTLQHLSSAAVPHGYSLILQNKRKGIVATFRSQLQKWAIEPESLGALPLRPQPQ